MSATDEASAKSHREQRDAIVRQLRAEDPKTWTLGTLARDIGCSRELIAYILKTGAV
jgi:AraC-like DNA-binding protein